MNVVLDTNVLVSAIFWNGSSFRLVERLLAFGHRIYSSEALLDELRHVLQRDFALSSDHAQEKIESIRRFVHVVEPRETLHVVLLDPNDDKVLECAVECGAEFVVSKDERHLLALKKFRDTRIVSPNQLLELI